MQEQLMVRCPNCGSFAKRHLLNHQVTATSQKVDSPQVIRTECPHCDYLMMICLKGKEIISVYSPLMSLFMPRSHDESLNHRD